MKVVLLTSSRRGTAAHHLPYLINTAGCEIAMVILSRSEVTDKKKKYRKVLRKILAIGPLGAWNGVRMRKWFSDDVELLKPTEDLEVLCNRNGIPFHETPSINSDLTVSLFQQAAADLGISLGNGYIGQRVFRIPRHGMVNIHHEMLPDYQNAQSIIWQIHNGSRNSGFTIHRIDKHIDTGEILLQRSVPIHFEDTLRRTVSRTCVALLEASAQGLVDVIINFDNLFKKARPQGHGRSYTTPTFRQFLRIRREYKRLK